MMVKVVHNLYYLDDICGDEFDWLDDDHVELEVQGVKYEDVFAPNIISRLHDG